MTLISLADIVMGLSSAIDLVSPQMADHHKRVAYIAYSISSEMGLPEKDRNVILVAGLLHDCGAIHDDEKLKAFRFDFGETMEERLGHGIKGWQILKKIEEVRPSAEIIKYHHLYWNEADALSDSYRILSRIRGFEKVNEWASYHHERLDGSGYPFRLKGDSLDTGARIMVVSDVFTALTEKGLTGKRCRFRMHWGSWIKWSMTVNWTGTWCTY